MNCLRELRKSHGLTAKDMAEKLNVSLSLYSKVECDDRLPSQNFLARFKAAFPSVDMNIFFESVNHISRTTKCEALVHSKGECK